MRFKEGDRIRFDWHDRFGQYMRGFGTVVNVSRDPRVIAMFPYMVEVDMLGLEFNLENAIPEDHIAMFREDELRPEKI